MSFFSLDFLDDEDSHMTPITPITVSLEKKSSRSFDGPAVWTVQALAPKKTRDWVIVEGGGGGVDIKGVLYYIVVFMFRK